VHHRRHELGRLLSVTFLAAPAHACRRRASFPPRSFVTPLLVTLLVLAATPAAGGAAPFCTSTKAPGWCIARRFAGTVKGGELGFRFGEPLDVDGDRRADVAAGARFKLWRGNQQNGVVDVWSGASGTLLREWDGEWPDALFGHWVMPVPDLSGDGLADVVLAAPHATIDGVMSGTIVARSPKTGAQIWRYPVADRLTTNLGWDMALAGDVDGDGAPDLYVGAPGGDTGLVQLVSGRDGSVVRTYAPRTPAGAFGWSVAVLDDVDGDGRSELAVGAPFAAGPRDTFVGAAFVLSGRSGAELLRWTGSDPRGGFGMMLAPVADVDGDGKRDLAVAAAGTEDQTRGLPGDVTVYSSKTGAPLRRWAGRQRGEQYGRMIAATDDVDGDGVADVAIGAPWHRRAGDDRVGRVELRSGTSGAVLAELVGDAADTWFGWHIVRAPDPDDRGRPALLIASLRHPVDGKVGVGVLDLYVRRPGAAGAAQGTKTRGARRSPIK
jgi:hypothetical protein